MFTKSNVRQIRQRLQKCVDELAADLKCHIEVGNATYSYDGSNCVFKVEMATLSEDGTADTREVTDFRSLAPSYGLEASDLGRKFVVRGKVYTICGLKPRSHKYPILANNHDGKTYKFRAKSVQESFAQESKT